MKSEFRATISTDFLCEFFGRFVHDGPDLNILVPYDPSHSLHKPLIEITDSLIAKRRINYSDPSLKLVFYENTAFLDKKIDIKFKYILLIPPFNHILLPDDTINMFSKNPVWKKACNGSFTIFNMFLFKSISLLDYKGLLLFLAPSSLPFAPGISQS